MISGGYGIDVIIVCHTEYGYVSRRELVFCKAAPAGVTEGAGRLAALADRYGARITFAVAPEAAESFPEGIAHEVGLHVHPGAEKLRNGRHHVLIGDRYLREHCPTSSTSTVLRDYGYEDQRLMIGTGRDRLRDVLGARARTFVAGRWSLNNDTIHALAAEGFSHDCSATPHRRIAHYDWSRLPRICMPYRPDAADYQLRGNLPLLIVPVSRSLLGASVTPELAPLVGLPWLKACFEEYRQQGMPLFHVCLHSPSMTDPYFVEVMESLIRHMADRGATFRFASEVPDYPMVSPSTLVGPYLAGFSPEMLNAGPALARKMAAAVRAGAGH